MTAIAERRMTLEDLHRHDGRAGLIGGRLVELTQMPELRWKKDPATDPRRTENRKP